MLEAALCVLSFWGLDPEPETCTNLNTLKLNEEVVYHCEMTDDEVEKFQSGDYYYCEDEDGGGFIEGGAVTYE